MPAASLLASITCHVSLGKTRPQISLTVQQKPKLAKISKIHGPESAWSDIVRSPNFGLNLSSNIQRADFEFWAHQPDMGLQFGPFPNTSQYAAGRLIGAVCSPQLSHSSAMCSASLHFVRLWKPFGFGA